MNTMMKKRIEDFMEEYLEENDFEDLLEEFDLTPTAVMLELFQSGRIDEELLNTLMGENYD